MAILIGRGGIEAETHDANSFEFPVEMRSALHSLLFIPIGPIVPIIFETEIKSTEPFVERIGSLLWES